MRAGLRWRGPAAWLLGLAATLAAAEPVDDAAWLDATVGRHVGGTGAPAAAAVVLHRGQAPLLRAWGRPQAGRDAATDAERTVFRVGSISKSFTAVAVLQLVDEGRLRLDEDVAPRLKGLALPAGRLPTRVVDLLTHRGGFDGDITTVGLDDPVAAARSPDERLQRDLHRVREPGRISVYDNMAFGLLGQLLESVEGQPLGDILQRRLFQPLGMTHTRLGLPEEASATAQAFETGPDGRPEARPQIHLRRGWRGAGDMSSTAGDMARWLQALLDEGRHSGGRLMSASSWAAFTDTQRATIVPGLPGTALGSYALGRAGGGGFGHAGTIRGFNALYMVMPREGVAVFAVMNLNRPLPEFTLPGVARYLSRPPGKAAVNPTDFMLFALPDACEQRWQPAPAPELPAALPAPATPASAWAGDYAYLRAEDNEALAPRVLAALLMPRVAVRAAEGGLTVDGGPVLRPAADGLYVNPQPADSYSRMAGFAQVDGSAVMGPHTLLSHRRVHGLESPALTVGGLLLAPLLWLLGAALRRPWTGQLSMSRVEVLAGSLIVATLAAELLAAATLQREWGWPLAVAAWRTLLHAAWLLAAWCAWRGVAEGLKTGGWRVRSQVLLQALWWLWLTLALGYWHVLGRL